MYADRYAGRHGLNPGGIAFSLGACAVLLFGLSLTAPHFTRYIDPGIKATNIPIDPPPPPKPEPTQQPKTPTIPHPAAPPLDPIDHTPPIAPTTAGDPTTPHIDPPPLPMPTTGTGDVGLIVPQHIPLIGKPLLDSRYAGNFQPDYPSDERLAGHEGRVVVRVLIGTDGRVKQVEQVSAASAAFFEATRKRALEKWRFKPGTRDGVAIEAWETMAVRFVIDEQ